MASPGKKAYPLRISPALWDQLQRLASRDLRSVNAEIEFLLREGLAKRGIKVNDNGTEAADAPGAADEPER